MAPTPTELKIVYGAAVVGAGGTAMLDGRRKFFLDLDRYGGKGVLQFSAIVDDPDPQAFATKLVAFEAVFTSRDQALKVSLGAVDLTTITPATNTGGFNTVSRITKAGDSADTGGSRCYTVLVTWEMPADGAADRGLRDLRFEVTASPAGIRTLTVSGTYTAFGGKSALEAYASDIRSRTDSIKQTLTGDGWEVLPEGEQFSVDRNQKTLTFRRVFRELVLNESSGMLDDPELSAQTLRIVMKRVAPGDAASNIERPVEFLVTYAAHVRVDPGLDDSAQVTVAAKWESKIKPWILEHLRTIAELQDLAIVDEAPSLDDGERQVTATLRLLGFTSDLLEYSLTIDRSVDLGLVLDPAWTGSKLAYVLYQGPSEDLTVRTERKVIRGRSSSPKDAATKPTLGDIFSGVQSALQDQLGIFAIDTPLSLEFVDASSDVNSMSEIGSVPGPAKGLLRRTRQTTEPIVWGRAPYQVEATIVTTVTVTQLVELVGAPKPEQQPGAPGGTRER